MLSALGERLRGRGVSTTEVRRTEEEGRRLELDRSEAATEVWGTGDLRRG